MGGGISRGLSEWEEQKRIAEEKKVVKGIPDWAQPTPGLSKTLHLRRMDVDLGDVEDTEAIKQHSRRRKGQRARRRFAEALPEGANGSFKHISKKELLAQRKAVVEQPSLRQDGSSAERNW